jgi:2-polyprenyl-3-methyl-5-hydroxy-6-metoxy-1,4-benzoquinol methylase
MKQQWNSFWRSSDPSRLTRMSHSKRRILTVLRRYLRPGMRTLDAGCGSGWFAATFVQMGMTATALDYSPEAVELARGLSNGRATCVVDDLLDPSLPDRLGERYDLIFTDGLFEHFSLSDQQRIMGNFKRLVAPSGYIATFVPNLLSPWQILRPFLMPGIKGKPFLLPRLQRLNDGMTVIEKGGLNVLPLALSPERILGSTLGMILYTIASERMR